MTDARSRQIGWHLLAATLLGLAVYWPLLTGSTPSARDMPFYFFPTKAALGEALGELQVPWIDRYRWGGMPLVGSPAYAPFYPLNLLFAGLPLAAAMNLWILTHVAVAITGFASFARRLGSSQGAAAVAGLLWGLSGPMVSMAVFPPTQASLALFPWFLLSCLALFESPRLQTVLRAGLTTALLVSAGIPEFVVLMAFSGIAVLAYVSFFGDSAAPWRSRLAAAAGAAFLGAAIAAPVLVSWLRTASGGVRGAFAGLGTELAGQNALPLFRWLDLLLDGRVHDWAVKAATLADGTVYYPYVPSITAGLLGTALGLLGLVTAGRRALVPAGLAILGLLLALGPATPVWKLLMLAAPPLKGLRYPEKYVFLFVAGVVWLAVLALAYLEKTLASRFFPAIAAALLLAIAIERGGIATDLIAPLPASYLKERPPVLSGLELPRGETPRTRIFHANSALELPLYDPGDIGRTNLWARASLSPGFASLFGASYVLEDDFDLTLPLAALEWTRLVSAAGKARQPVMLGLARYAGASAVLQSQLSADKRWIPGLRRLEPLSGAFRFASTVVSEPDGEQLVKIFLADGADPERAYVEGPSVRRVVPRGVILAVSDRADGLRLDVRNDDPSPAFLMLLRMQPAVAEAFLDGQPMTTVPMTFGFAGCWIPSGEHRLLFRPETRWLRSSLLVASLALSLTAALLWRQSSWRKPSAGAVEAG